jgi:hypothetical protein
MSESHTDSADKMSTRLYLNENMSRYIRGTAIALFSEGSKFIGYVPSFDSPDFFNMRVRLTEALISNTEMMYLSGNLRDSCQLIIKENGG